MKKGILFFGAFLFLFATTVKAAESIPGIGAWQELPFAKIRFVSCLSNVHAGLTYLAIEAEPKSGWTLQNPHLTTFASDNSPGSVFIPFRHWDEHQLFYPISYVVQAGKNPITFTVQGNWTACQNTNCTTVPVHSTLTLNRKTPIITPICSGISFAVANTPIPMYMNKVKAFATWNADKDTVHLTIHLDHTPHTITVFDDQKQQLSITPTIHNRQIDMDIPLSRQTQDLKLYIHSGLYYYEVNTPVLPANTPAPQIPLTVKQILLIGFLMFLFSPWFLYWGRTHHKTLDQYQEQNLGAIITVLLFNMALILTACNIIPQSQMVTVLTDKKTILTTMGIAFFFADMMPIVAGIFAWLTPRPYLADFANQSLYLKISILICILCTTLVPFVLQRIYAKKIMSKMNTVPNASMIWWCFRLPWLAFMLWIYFYL